MTSHEEEFIRAEVVRIEQLIRSNKADLVAMRIRGIPQDAPEMASTSNRLEDLQAEQNRLKSVLESARH